MRLGAVQLDVEQRRLLIDGRPAKLGARAFDVLLALVERRDRFVTKDELLRIVWPNLVVEENNLQVQVSALRKMLGPTAIVTVGSHGYRFALELDATLLFDARSDITTKSVGGPEVLEDMVMALALPGQRLLTGAARAALGDVLAKGTEIESHGYYRLKGLQEPVEIFELGVRGASPFMPPTDSDKACRVVRAGDFWRPVREVRHNLPAERDAFVGRTAELQALAARLNDGARILTVLGPGGTGKTRFIRRYGWTWLGDWPGGIYFCDLSEARSLEGIFFAVASALEVPLGKDEPAVQLGHAIAGRGRCLVILDNFEQVLVHASATLGRWLDRAADATFVVTSRERLHLPGEEILAIEPLPLKNEAIDLFVARARSQKPDFVVSDANRAAVAEAVRLLDGLPLAIELAAARVRVLSPAQLVERMRDRFSLLVGARGAAARQATLKAAIDWSWDLLTPWEQAALAQCAVFEGGFTLAAAEAVLDVSAWPDAPSSVDVVQALVDKSLLRTWVPNDRGRYDLEESYFGMYVSIHEYATEKLKASEAGAERAVEERHGRYFAGFGMEEALEALGRHGGVRRRRALALDLDNLVAACRRAIARRAGETAVAAYRAAWEVLEVQGPISLGADLGAQVLAVDGIADSLRVRALMTRARATGQAGRMDEAVTWLEEAFALARAQRDRGREASIVRGALGGLRREQGRMEEARGHFEFALAVHRELGDRRFEGMVLAHLGLLHTQQGRMDEARAHLEDALAILREVGDRRFEGIVLGNLGELYREQGRMDEALAYCLHALTVHREVGNRRFAGAVLGNIGILHQERGQMVEARAHYDQALAIHREVGNRRFEGNVLGNLGLLHSEQGRIEEAQAHYAAALAIDREVGNRHSEGFVLGNLADLLLQQGRIDDARERLQAGEALLQEVGDLLQLAKLCCVRGRIEATVGDIAAARAALAEAETVAAAIGAGPDSELGHEVAKLRAALA